VQVPQSALTGGRIKVPPVSFNERTYECAAGDVEWTCRGAAVGFNEWRYAGAAVSVNEWKCVGAAVSVKEWTLRVPQSALMSGLSGCRNQR